MQLRGLMNFSPLLLALMIGPLFVTTPALAELSPSLSHQQAYQMLKDGNAPFVRELPPGEREILMATLALEENHSSEAIELLNSPNVGKDPVAARLRAEAYRRKSIQAANRAGKYAHSVSADIGKLEHAGIELESARQRLKAFIDRVDGMASSKPVAVAQPVASVVRDVAALLTESVREAVDSWRRDWESRNADAYLAHYHAQFTSGEHDLASWSVYKRRVNGNKRYIHIGISQLKIIDGPRQTAQGEAVLVAFSQKYESSNYSANSIKRLYLVREQAGKPWLILGEGGRSLSLGRIVDRQLVENNPPLSMSAAWVVNLASFDSKEAAEKMVGGIRMPGRQQLFVAATAVAGRMVHRVRIGLYDGKSDATGAMLSICARLGLSDCWLEQVNK